MRGRRCAVSHRELTTVLTTRVLTVVATPDLSGVVGDGFVVSSARAYGSEGWGFESLRARLCDVSGHRAQVSWDIVHGFVCGW
jgi:hypothetical protein